MGCTPQVHAAAAIAALHWSKPIDVGVAWWPNIAFATAYVGALGAPEIKGQVQWHILFTPHCIDTCTAKQGTEGSTVKRVCFHPAGRCLGAVMGSPAAEACWTKGLCAPGCCDLQWALPSTRCCLECCAYPSLCTPGAVAATDCGICRCSSHGGSSQYWQCHMWPHSSGRHSSTTIVCTQPSSPSTHTYIHCTSKQPPTLE